MNPSPSQLRWTGLFLVAGLALALGVVAFLLGSRHFQKKLPLVCELRGESAAGLSTGGRVMLRGIEVGNVVSLGFDRDDPERILVGIEVVPTAPVYENATATLEIFGITGLKYLELRPGDPRRRRARPGAVLMVVPSRTAELLNTVDTIARSSARVLANLEGLTGHRRQEQIDSIVLDLRSTSRDFSGMARELRSLHLERQMGEIAGHVETAARRIDSTIAVIDPARSVARIDTAVEAVSGVARRADLMLGRSQGDVYRSLEDLNTTLRNLSDFSQTIRDNPGTLLRSGERNGR